MKSNKSKMRCKRGFTLIELLVVVLIIGILAAVAVPQYQVAVKKAQMTEYMMMVRAIVKAEEVYRLENGEYTNDLQKLSLSWPEKKGGCEFTTDEWCSFYECAAADVVYGVCDDITNAQAGTKETSKYRLRYTEHLADAKTKITGKGYFFKGDRGCQCQTAIDKKVCNSLGATQKVTKQWYRFP